MVGKWPMPPQTGYSKIFLMTTLDLARSQFGITTLFHFIFVPMSIGWRCSSTYVRPWVGYFILEGFDFGVGMLVRGLGRDPAADWSR